MTSKEPWNTMTEKERIDFIREHGTESMEKGLKSVFGNNKYKPLREDMWVNRLYRGKKMVRTIFSKTEEAD